MTAQNRVTLKAAFEQGDVPDGDDYIDLMDSFVNLVETSAQAMSGPLTTTILTASEVSAGNMNVTTKVSALAANFLGVVSASSMAIGSDLTVTVSASIGELNCTSLRVNTAITAAATIGTGEAIPASVAGYALVNINGTSYRIPLFLAD